MKKGLKLTLTAILIAAVNLFSCLSSSAEGYTGASAVNASTPGEDNITLTYYCPLPSSLEGVVSNLSEVEVYKELEKRTNVKVNFIHTQTSNQIEKFFLMLASGDMPDLAELPWSQYPGVLQNAIASNSLQPLDDLIGKYAPNLDKALQTDLEARKQITADNGHIYIFPSLNLSENKVNYGPVMRTDLLKKLGLKSPETISEWETVLKALKDNYPGITPLSFDTSTLRVSNSFIGAFGTSMDFIVKNGRVAYGPTEASYKDFLETFSKWYRMGYLDREFITLKNSQITSKIASGKVGASISKINHMGTLITAIKEFDANTELAAAKNPVLNIGDKLTASAYNWENNIEGNVVLSRTCKHAAEAVKWLDYAFSEEGHLLFNYGIEGLTYTLENGKPKYTDLILNNPDGLSANKAVGKYMRAIPPAPGWQDGSNTSQLYRYEEERNAEKLWSDGIDLGTLCLMPRVSLTLEESNEYSMIMRDVSTYTQEMFARFVLGVISIDEYKNYVKKVPSLGINRATEIMQMALQRYISRLDPSAVMLSVNKKLPVLDTKPIKRDRDIMIPIRAVFETLGCKVNWNKADMTASAISGDVSITFKFGSTDLIVNGEHKTLSKPIELIGNRAYISMDSIPLDIGIKIVWDENIRTVKISN